MYKGILRYYQCLRYQELFFNSLTTETKKVEFANSVNLDEVAHYEPPHLDLHYLHSSL